MFTLRLDSAGMLVFDGSPQACWSLMGHVGLEWFSDLACRSPMEHVGLQSGMSVSNGACRSPIRLVGLRWISDRSPIIILFL